MLDAILLAIATSLADKSAGTLYDFVRNAFSKRPAAIAALTAADGAAPESAEVHALAWALESAEQEDPAFREDLRSRWEAVISNSAVADHGGTVNQISGNVGKAVQAHDIHGDVSL